jgi:hypothetical protein
MIDATESHAESNQYGADTYTNIDTFTVILGLGTTKYSAYQDGSTSDNQGNQKNPDNHY